MGDLEAESLSEESVTSIIPKDQPPIKPAIDVWIEGIDALRELVDLLEKVSTLALKDDDVVVLKVGSRLTMQMREELLEQAKAVFGEERKIVILDKDVDLAVVSADAVEDEGTAPFARRLEKADFPALLRDVGDADAA